MTKILVSDPDIDGFVDIHIGDFFTMTAHKLEWQRIKKLFNSGEVSFGYLDRGDVEEFEDTYDE